MPLIEFNPKLTIKQTEAWDWLEDADIDEVLYGGAKYGGKSWFLCVWAFLTALMLCVKYKLPQVAKPLPIGFLGRKVAKNFADTTLETWFKTIPEGGYEIRGNPVEIIIDHRVKIHTGGLDNRETVNKFNSAEYAFFGIDQAEETTRDDIALLRGATKSRLVINDQAIAGKGLFTANPADCWLKREFITACGPRRRFVSALPTDNPYCTQGYIENLKDAFKHRPELLKAYLFGNWNVLAGATQVIQEAWIRSAFTRDDEYAPIIKEYICIDAARYGDDECVICFFRNLDIIEKRVLPFCSTTDIAAVAKAMSERNDKCQIVVEAIGSDLGAGVVDILVDMGADVVVFNPALPSSMPKEFYSLRCEAWHNAGKILHDGIIDPLSNCAVALTPHGERDDIYGMDETTITQLCAPGYKWRAGKLVVEPKDETKKRLGRSPDHADVFVIAIWAWPYIERVGVDKGGYDRLMFDKYHQRRRRGLHRATSAMET